MSGLGHAVAAFAGRRVLVMGDAMLDSYVRGRSERLSREAPVPIVELERQDDAPGGAANAAANLAALGADVRLLGVVGDDDEAHRLERSLEALGVECGALLRDAARVTLAKRRIMAAGQMLVRLDQGSRTELSAPVRSSVEERLSTLHEWADAILVSDYGYGVMDDAVIGMLGELGGRRRRLLIVDAKEPERFARLAPDAAEPN